MKQNMEPEAGSKPKKGRPASKPGDADIVQGQAEPEIPEIVEPAENAADDMPEAENQAVEAEVIAEEPAENAPDERYLRLAAEYDNYRKRTARERETLVSDSRFFTITQLLPVLDNLERAASQPCTDAAYAQGVEMIVRQWLELLEKLGVTPIDAQGQPFDPNLHSAVMHVEDDSLPENSVAEVFQKGYRAGERVLRHSMVKVAN